MDSTERGNQQEHVMVYEMMRNQRNRKIIFEQKLPKQLHLQSQLKLNGVHESKEKKLILSFMKSPEFLS